MITPQGYLKTRIYAMGAQKMEGKCKKVRGYQKKSFHPSPIRNK
jgi:hypothetical protein